MVRCGKPILLEERVLFLSSFLFPPQQLVGCVKINLPTTAMFYSSWFLIQKKKKKKKLMQLNDLASKKKKGPLNQGEISRILWHEKQLHFPAPQKNIASKHSN